jgi:hypothetical protein
MPRLPMRLSLAPGYVYKFLLWWVLATVAAYVTGLLLVSQMLAGLGALGVGVALVAGPILSSVLQGLVLQRYMPGLVWWRWPLATATGLGRGLLVALGVVGACAVGAWFLGHSSQGGDYMPSAATMLLVAVAGAAFIITWVAVWASVSYAQWGALQRRLGGLSVTVGVWAVLNTAGATVIGGAALAWDVMESRNSHGDADLGDSSLLALFGFAICAGTLAGFVSGGMLQRMLRGRPAQDR